MLLSDATITEYINRGYLSIHPFSLDQVQPASYDVLLSDNFAVFNTSTEHVIRPWEKQENLYTWTKTQEFILHPGKFCLASTLEYFNIPPYLAAQVGGKSSLGRLGLIVHATAGFIDPGFEGTITLEMGNVGELPICLRAGMPIGQLTFAELTGVAQKPYRGKYQGQTTTTASRYYLNNLGATDAVGQATQSGSH
jgi:dCTP deaminase